MDRLRKVMSGRVGLMLVVSVVLTLAGATTVLASHAFTDVDAANPFHDDIDAIADAGVTLGCNPGGDPAYCPEDNVTREQMAAFLNRLGALDPGQEPVVNARSVGGLGLFADIVEVAVTNDENNDEECEATASLLGTGHAFGTFFITYQLLGAPSTIFTFEVNVAASDRSPETVEEPGEFLICFATIDGSELPDGTYRLFAIEAHEIPPVTD